MNKTHFSEKQNVLTVTRTFDAELDLVWRAWTEAELLDQWWAPKPWKSVTSHMDFKVGGHRIYAMVGPEGEKHVGRTDYVSINEKKDFAGEDAFCDDDGNINPDFPIATFINQFESNANSTLVTIETEYASEEHLKQVIEMGMKEGLSAAFENLDAVLIEVNK
jgi:uncharacterized protein YndB with AHSA1/START domain